MTLNLSREISTAQVSIQPQKFQPTIQSLITESKAIKNFHKTILTKTQD